MENSENAELPEWLLPLIRALESNYHEISLGESDLDSLDFAPGGSIKIIPGSSEVSWCSEKLIVLCLKGGVRGTGKGHINFRQGLENAFRKCRENPAADAPKGLR